MSEKNESTLFRKKPVVVQAVQYPCEHPALQRCSCGANSACSSCGREFIQTLEGRMNVSPGDWIITGVQGEHYPCKPDIFAATYEPAAAPASSAPGDAQDERQADEEQPYGWLYDWTHSSATGRPDEQYTGFTKDETHAKKNDNPRAVYLAAPAAGDALDSKRLKWIAQNAWALRDLENGRKNALARHAHVGALDRLRSAVDAALAAQVPQQGEA